MATTDFFSELQEDPAQVLIERGISEEQAARGYFSTREKHQLESLGFNRSQAATAASHKPVLVIPLHGPNGEIENYQIRPNRPREIKRAGKKPRMLKYELPAGTTVSIVCPPTERQRESLKASVPLFITESALKADAGLGIGLLTVGILGVDGWRARNAYDGVTTHPAWEEINLKRIVYFAHDSDCLENKRIRRTLKRHGRWLAYKGATVKYIFLPSRADGSKCGLDDFIGDHKARGLSDEEIRAELLKYASDELPNDANMDSTEPTFNATDMGNAERFVYQHRRKVRYCEKLGGWFVWDGRRYEKDETGAVYRLAKETVRTIYREAGRTLDEDRRKELASWASMSERLQRIEAMIRLASKDEAVAVLPEDFDKDPYLLNVGNGIIDLRTGILKAHDPADLITKLAPVTYDADADMPLTKEWLFEIKEKPALTAEEIRRVIKATDESFRSLLFCIALTGLRIGELLGLQWQDIDFDRRRLSVVRTLWRGHLLTPKTKGSRRTLHLPAALVEVLTAYRAQARWDGHDDFVFAREDGSALNAEVVRIKILYPALERAGIARGKSTHGFHLFRHSAASIVHAETRDLTLAQELLGHTRLSTTADIYTHTSGAAEEATETLAREIWQSCGLTVAATSAQVH